MARKDRFGRSTAALRQRDGKRFVDHPVRIRHAQKDPLHLFYDVIQ
ncbi:hypothetical protein ABG088_02915 [Hydrogenibacillus schlegelii]|nr:hypothetical protein [Hydrogenibacillus schlegelii]